MKNSPGETGRSLFLTKKGPAQNAQDPSGLWVHRELVGRDVGRIVPVSSALMRIWQSASFIKPPPVVVFMGVRALCSQKPRHSLALRLAVAAAVDTAGRVRQHELLGQLLLHGGDAAGVLAGENAGDPLR